MLLACASITLASDPHQTPVVISLSDTAAQKAKVQSAKAAPVKAEVIDVSQAETKPSEPGFFKRLFNRAETEAQDGKKVSDAGMDWRSRLEQRAQAREARKEDRHFDDHFRKYSKHYFGIGADWRWFRAQAMVESEMKPTVRSKSGAMGLMQIMPKTFHEIRSRNPHLKDPFDPYFNIAAGIYYNRQLYDAWPNINDEDDRRRFMFASYNAGLGNVKRAAKRVGNPSSYSALAPALPPGPRHYLVKIERERKKLSN